MKVKVITIVTIVAIVIVVIMVLIIIVAIVTIEITILVRRKGVIVVIVVIVLIRWILKNLHYPRYLIPWEVWYYSILRSCRIFSINSINGPEACRALERGSEDGSQASAQVLPVKVATA